MGPLRTVLLRVCLLAVMPVLVLGACDIAAPQPVAHRPPVPASSAAPPRAIPGQPGPARLVIAAIKVNAVVESVGVKTNGDLETPTHNPWEDVGWYSTGPRPGEQGSAVIDGHVDRTGGGPAVFWRLSDLHVGDSVVVTDSAGKTWKFHVTRIAFYQPQAAPLQEIFGNWGGIYLNLITCAGDWIPSQHQTTLRLVVYTQLG